MSNRQSAEIVEDFRHTLFCLTSTPFIFLAVQSKNRGHKINVGFAKGKKSLDISVGNWRSRIVGGG